MNILCVIPARSGSKGIIDKNIKDFKGKPLLAWSIEQAKECKYPMRIIVSTDSLKYAQTARSYGAEVPFIRPPGISQDHSTDLECMDHLLKSVDHPDIILHLRPTSPLRKVQDINQALDLFIEKFEEYDSLRSIVPVDKSPFKMYRVQDNTLVPLFTEVNGIKEPYNQARQVLPDCYLHNGYIDIFKPETIFKGSVTGTKILPYLMNKNEILDIDYPQDLKWENGKS